MKAVQRIFIVFAMLWILIGFWDLIRYDDLLAARADYFTALFDAFIAAAFGLYSKDEWRSG